MGLARGLLGLVSMPLLANLTSWLRPQPENGIPCGTILKQSKMHVQHQRVFFLPCLPGGILALSAAPMDHREASRPPKPRCTGPPRPCMGARGVGVMVA